MQTKIGLNAQKIGTNERDLLIKASATRKYECQSVFVDCPYYSVRVSHLTTYEAQVRERVNTVCSFFNLQLMITDVDMHS